MNINLKALFCILVLVGLAGTTLSACGSSSSTPTAVSVSTKTSTGTSSGPDGQALMQQRCSRCHSLNRVISAHHTAAEWQNTVNRMLKKGAQLNPQEQQTLIAYLAQNYK